MSFKIESSIAQHGERFSQLYMDKETFALFYPTAFISYSKRLAITHATQLIYFRATKLLCEW